MTVAPLLAPEITVIETVTRHPLNFYESPSWFTTELLRHVPLSGVIGEPCVGHGAIASLLNVWPHTEHIWTNDIDPHKQDHVIPVVKGGKSKKGNLVPCCRYCNSSKNQSNLNEWLAKNNIIPHEVFWILFTEEQINE